MTQDNLDELWETELEYFNKQYHGSNEEYWRRLGDVDLRGKSVLDVGCGHGALSVYAARQGAAKVVGVDIDHERIAFARKNVERNYPDIAPKVSFLNQSLESVHGSFDLVVSKDSFEHIEDLYSVMDEIKSHLNNGGLLVTGFSPLYFSPFGDHGRYWRGQRKLPWLPVLLPEPILFRLASRRRDEVIRSASDVGLNKLTPAEFRRIVSDQRWDIVSLQTNRGDKAGIKLMRRLSQIRLLEKYFTVSIYAQLRKPI